MKNYTFYIIRHAKSAFRDPDRPEIVGSMDLELSEEGKKEASEAGKRLLDRPVEAVFCSKKKRACQTAKLLYPNSTPLVIDGIEEYNFGSLEGKTFEEELGKDYDWDDFFNLVADCKDAEHQKPYMDRISGAFAKILEGCMKSGTMTAAIVSHGFTIMHLMAAFTYPKLDKVYDWACGNCCGFVLKTDTAMWMRDRALETVGVINDGNTEMFERL